MKKLLEVKDLEVIFTIHSKKLHAVRKINFSLLENETLGIVGESGCGKSVTAQSILKLIPTPPGEITNGEILFENEDLLKKSYRAFIKYRGKKISMIFQDPMTALNPTMKIGKQLTEIIREKNKKAKAIELLNLVGISEAKVRFSQYPHQLSGGQRQRIMIAIAIAQSPKIIIADEPTTSLDVTIQSQILDLLKEIQKKTLSSMIFISHDLSVVSEICDRIIVMYAGKIVEEGPTKKLIFSPKHPYTKLLLNATANMHDNETLTPIKGYPPTLYNPPKGCPFAERCPYVMEICENNCPPFYGDENSHKAACYLHDEKIQKDRLKDVIKKQTPSDKKSEKIFFSR